MTSAGFGVYVHWPYCARICPYCDFNVYRARDQDPEPLLAAIAADLAAHAARLDLGPADTLFLGGGTPSLLPGLMIARLITAVRATLGLKPGAEITLEANPEDADRFTDHARAGVNRFSLGVQALNDADLKALGRWHSADQARAAVAAAVATGQRVSLDLIYAREGQTQDGWAAELTQALALPVEHLSLYQLTIEPGTAFARRVARGALTPPGPDPQADLFALTRTLCAASGFDAYEVSNFARTPAARSAHNLVYWRSGAWVGVGPGAHGRLPLGDGRRWATQAVRTPEAYIAQVAAQGVGWDSAEPLDPAEAAAEAILMGLRLAEGMPRGWIAPAQSAVLADLTAQGLIWATADRIGLTADGVLLADAIAGQLCP
jgi:oxygen-independent coproporphyrinogen-3 oxidase